MKHKPNQRTNVYRYKDMPSLKSNNHRLFALLQIIVINHKNFQDNKIYRGLYNSDIIAEFVVGGVRYFFAQKITLEGATAIYKKDFRRYITRSKYNNVQIRTIEKLIRESFVLTNSTIYQAVNTYLNSSQNGEK